MGEGSEEEGEREEKAGRGGERRTGEDPAVRRSLLTAADEGGGV